MISNNYTDYLNRTEIKILDYLRIIADLVSANSDVANRIVLASKYANIVQKILNIPAQHEVAVGVLAVLFCHSRIYGKVPFKRLRIKMGLVDLLNPLVVEDFIYLLNEKYITLEKSVQNIEYISSTDELYKELWSDMTEENRKLFMMVSGKTLTAGQLNFFKSQLYNEGLDIGELFITCVVCANQTQAAKAILDFGWDMNKETEIMAYELFICSQYNSSKFCVDFYLAHGLKITAELIEEMVKIAQEHQDDFDYDETEKLVEELKQKMVKE